MVSLCFEFLVNKYNESHPLNVGLTWKVPVLWLSLSTPFRASRFLMGNRNARGSSVISLKVEKSHKEVGAIMVYILHQVYLFAIQVSLFFRLCLGTFGYISTHYRFLSMDNQSQYGMWLKRCRFILQRTGNHLQ